MTARGTEMLTQLLAESDITGQYCGFTDNPLIALIFIVVTVTMLTMALRDDGL